jgi:hypothetical protein
MLMINKIAQDNLKALSDYSSQNKPKDAPQNH